MKKQILHYAAVFMLCLWTGFNCERTYKLRRTAYVNIELIKLCERSIKLCDQYEADKDSAYKSLKRCQDNSKKLLLLQ